MVLHVLPSRSGRFPLALRIPAWSARTACQLNGKSVGRVRPGAYLRLDRVWRRGDTIDLRLDMSLHVWPGRRECEGLAAVYRGPLLLSWDRRLNAMDPAEIAPLMLSRPAPRRAAWSGPRPPLLLLAARGADGQRVNLCDFASAGSGGSPYRSWLPVADMPALRASPFTPDRVV